MKNIRYGIIGFGRFAESTIAPAIRQSKNSELVAIQKRSLDAATEKAKELNVPLAFSTAEDLVKSSDVDAVFIVSANTAHAPETILAARHGKHVLCEKPMAMNVDEAEQMIAACHEHRVKLAVGHMVRLSPAVVRIKELIRSGVIGTVVHIKTEFIYDGRLSKRWWLIDPAIAGGGATFDIGVHCLDTTRFLLDDEVVSVKSELAPLPDSTRTESTVMMALRFSKGTTAGIFCSYRAPIRRSFIEVIGTDGIISVDHFTRSGMTIPLTVIIGRNGEVAEQRTEEIVVPNLYEEEVTRFSNCILNDEPSPLSGENALANQRVINAAIEG